MSQTNRIETTYAKTTSNATITTPEQDAKGNGVDGAATATSTEQQKNVGTTICKQSNI